MTTTATKYDPEPKWKLLSLRTLRDASKEVLGQSPKKRTMKGAYEELYTWLTKESGRDLAFTCHTCDSLIDDKMEKCWACGLVFDSESAEEEPVVDSELAERAKKLGIAVNGQSRENILVAIEEAETKTRKAKKDVDLLAIEAGKINEKLSEEMPDGWRKARAKQYTSYFDENGVRRIAVFHRGLKVLFSVDDGFLDGFPEIEFYDAEERKRRHYGRVNYQYTGDMAKQVIDLSKRIFTKHGS